MFSTLEMTLWFKMAAGAPDITSLFWQEAGGRGRKKIRSILSVYISLKEFSQKSNPTIPTYILRSPIVFKRGLGIQSFAWIEITVIEWQLTFSATTVPDPRPYKYTQLQI